MHHNHEEASPAIIHLLLDHKVVREIIDKLEIKLDEFERKNEISISFMFSFVNFTEKFLDRCHHGKEEKCFFPALEKTGNPYVESPITIMKMEHAEMKDYIKKIEEQLIAYKNGKEDPKILISTCRDLIGLIRSHFFKEENILFRIGGRELSKEENFKTVDCYEEIEKDSDHEKLLAEAEELKRS
ncbi:MAG TPA: hemerythrin domain-containing protein [Geobacterales bacterium]|nr:hemerythrin domain-containing protein [Geobacterales bacterium]